MQTTKLFFMAALALTFAACSNDDNDIQNPAQPAKAEGIPFTATISIGQSASTRALTENGTTIEATWAENDEVALIHNDVIDKVTVASVTGGVATITGSITGSPTDGDAVTVVYPYSAVDATTKDVKADLLAEQDGTLATIATNYDVRKGTGTLKVSGDPAVATLNGIVSLTNQFAIFKFTTQDDVGSDINVKALIITIGSQDYEITPATATSELYAALPAISGQEVSFFAHSVTGSNIQNYTYSKTSVTFDEGKYYQSTLKMPKAVPTNVAFINDNRNNYFEPNGTTTNYFRCELYNPWNSENPTYPITPASIQMKKYQKVNVTFNLTGFTFGQTAKMVLCCNRGSEASWEPDCYSYSRAISVGSNGTCTVSWTNYTGSTINWGDGQSALTMTMQYNGYASLANTSAEGLKAACEIVSITID